MSHFNTKQSFFIPSYSIDVKEIEKIDRFLVLLEKSGVFDLVEKSQKISVMSSGGRPNISVYDMLATILYCFAFDNGSLRNMEDRCKFDLRVIYLMSNEKPTYATFSNYINTIILPVKDEIFSLITSAVFQECGLEMKDLYIDGSKFEADANKYKFVWKPTKFHTNLSNKIRELLSRYDLSISLPEEGIIESSLIAKNLKLLIERYKDTDLTLKENKQIKKDINSMTEYYSKSLEYEQKERICGQDRNSYYKTDHDATAMCLKEDYYSGLGSNMHAAYNTQLAVSNGLITTYLVTQSRTDIKDFIPLLKKHYKNYGCFPDRVCADAGYGSLYNYRFMSENHIENYVKHQSWEGEVSGKNPRQYHYNSDKDTITCLNGIEGKEVEIPYRHPRNKEAVFYKIEGCNSCGFRLYCKKYMKNKDEDFKILEVVKELQKYINESEENLLSPIGIEMRVNRSVQVEGAFGIIKQDMMYTRFRRTSIERVRTEFMLTCLGFNIRKLFKYYDGEEKFTYWEAPKTIETERKKKPSAKRLSNKASKKGEKSVNEISKKYKYK